MNLRSLSYKQTRGIIRQRSFAERAVEWLGKGEESFEMRTRRRYTIVASQTKRQTGKGLDSPMRGRRTESDLRRRVSKWLTRRFSSGLRPRQKNKLEMTNSTRTESTDSLGSTVTDSDCSEFHEVKVRSVEDVHGLFEYASSGSSPPTSPRIDGDGDNVKTEEKGDVSSSSKTEEGDDGEA